MKNVFATSIAPNLAPAITAATPVSSLSFGDLVSALKAAMAPTAEPAPAVQPAKAPRGRKAKAIPAPVVAPVAAAPAAAPEAPVDYVLEAKKMQCRKAGNAAVKAAGLAWNGIKGEGSKGGRFDKVTGAQQTVVFKAAYNVMAKELGIPGYPAK